MSEWTFAARMRHYWGARGGFAGLDAWLRAVVFGVLWGYEYEICRDCGRPVGFSTGHTYWITDDEVWRRVTGDDNGLLCIPCFADRAFAEGEPIYWEARIESCATDSSSGCSRDRGSDESSTGQSREDVST